MTEAKLIVVAEFPNRIAAELAQGALEAADIESFVAADDAGGLHPELWMTGVKLFVREPDATRARELLNAD